MKKRIITAIVAVIYAFGIVFSMHYTPIPFILSVAVFAAVSVRELCSVIGVGFKSMKFPSMAYAAANILLLTGNASYKSIFNKEFPIDFNVIVVLMGIVYVLYMLLVLLQHYEYTNFETVATLTFMSVCTSLSFAVYTKLPVLYYYFPKTFNQGDSMFMFIYSMIVCWTFDGGAYFVGSKLGKHKMSPKISPKKSWEGYFGGIVVVEICALGYYFLFKTFAKGNMQLQMEHLLPIILIATPVLATLSILGDLSASVIKRNFKAKDFGNFFPGHGGVLDRYDSVLYVVPILYLILRITAMVK